MWQTKLALAHSTQQLSLALGHGGVKMPGGMAVGYRPFKGIAGVWYKYVLFQHDLYFLFWWRPPFYVKETPKIIELPSNLQEK